MTMNNSDFCDGDQKAYQNWIYQNVKILSV